ncbi:hypothetical protein [uncultured Sphingomonas sp.]|uniref:hypothetical protein n=1 Tax=uncultured Sphingomonas sp. TaxID=158754 RepID=UPI0026327AF3|nr:hypothetical protein [uncultured Sphingomonas sp.]
MKYILLAAAALLATPAIAQEHPSAAAQLGGLEPSTPALQGTPAPGSPVIFKQAPAPDVAFPPPAAQASYPICKKGQFDKCQQAGTGDGHVDKAAPRHHHAKRHMHKAEVKTASSK